jgi:hypothetical protein
VLQRSVSPTPVEQRRPILGRRAIDACDRDRVVAGIDEPLSDAEEPAERAGNRRKAFELREVRAEAILGAVCETARDGLLSLREKADAVAVRPADRRVRPRAASDAEQQQRWGE